MKKILYLVLVVFLLLSGSILPAQADGHGHGGWHGGGHGGWHGGGHFFGSVWIGPGWGAGWWGPGWWGYGYPYYPYYPYYSYSPGYPYYSPPSGYDEPTPQAEQQYYWYFCPEARNYYPYVKQCPKGWLKVVPPSAPSDYRE